MKALVLSDWHLNKETDIDLCFKYIDKIHSVFEKDLVYGELLFIIVCGDIIDHGEIEMFNAACSVISYLIQRFSDYTVYFAAIPGNHDFSLDDKSFVHFDECVNQFARKTHRFENEPTYALSINGINLIFTNSLYMKYRKKGCLNYSKIYNCLNRDTDTINILFAHHSIIGINDKDNSIIRNGQPLLDMINKNEIQIFIHGHSHERGYLENSAKLNIIAIGPTFKLKDSDIQQFLLIDFDDKKSPMFVPFIYTESKKEYEPLHGYENRVTDFFDYINAKNELLSNLDIMSNYISRKVVAYNKLTGSLYELYFNESEAKTLFNFCLENKRVVILGEAGCGKTFELKNLYQTLLSNSSVFLPIYIELRNYIGETIQELIPDKFSVADKKKLFLIFDGYDEIESSKIKLFAQHLNNFTGKNVDTHILISSRSNFYLNTNDRSKNGLFFDFAEVGLFPISKDFTQTYCNEIGVNFTDLANEAYRKDVSDLISNPFYLVDLIEEFHTNRVLPIKNKIMEALIHRRFDDDGIKYCYQPINIEERTIELNFLLDKIAFSMQCLNKNYFTNDEYESLFTFNQRHLAKYSGLIKKNVDKWEFSHNNFREYLAARFLSNNPLDYIISVITLPDDNKVTRNSWFNVFSYLILIYKKDDLLEWVKANDPIKLIKFESNRIDENTRKSIFIAIFENINKKNVWISHSISNISEYAKFGQSKDIIFYLFDQIKNYKHFRQQANALIVLSEIDIKELNMVLEVKEMILWCLKSKKVRNYEKNAAINVLINADICDDEILSYIISLFVHEYDPEIRCPIYDLLIKKKSVEKNIDYILDGITNNKKVKYDTYTSIDYRIYDAFSMVESVDSIIKIIKLFSEKIECDYELFYKSEKILEEILDKAKLLYKTKSEIFIEVVKLFIFAEKEYNRNVIQLSKNFFKETNTVFNLYEYIVENSPTNRDDLILDDIMDYSCEIDMAKRYSEGSLKYPTLFISFVQRRGENCSNYSDIKRIIKEKDNIEISDRKVIDYESIRISGNKRYFNSLFNKDDYIHLVRELINAFEDSEIDNKTIVDKSFMYEEKRHDLDLIRWDLYHSTEKSMKIKDLLEIIDWQLYLFYNIYRFIQNNKNFMPSDEQITIIQNTCQMIISQINVENEMTYYNDGRTTFTYKLCALTFLSSRFKFVFSKKDMIKFLYVPSYLFEENRNITYIFSEYVTNSLSDEDLKAWVINEIQRGKPSSNLALTLINYCKSNNMDIASPLAESLMKESNLSEMSKRYCAEYIISIYGEDYICNLLLPTKDMSVINALKSLKLVGNTLLEKSLIDINEKSEKGLSELGYLFSMNSEYAIKKYLAICKRLKRIPDYSKEENTYPSITEALSCVTDIKFLPEVHDLLILCNSKGFKDKQAFGLGHSLNKIIKNFASQDHKKAQNMLDEIIENYSDNYDLVCTCNYCLLDINYAFYQSSDKPFEFNQIKQKIDDYCPTNSENS